MENSLCNSCKKIMIDNPPYIFVDYVKDITTNIELKCKREYDSKIFELISLVDAIVNGCIDDESIYDGIILKQAKEIVNICLREQET